MMYLKVIMKILCILKLIEGKAIINKVKKRNKGQRCLYDVFKPIKDFPFFNNIGSNILERILK